MPAPNVYGDDFYNDRNLHLPTHAPPSDDHRVTGSTDEAINRHIHQYLLERGYNETADRFKAHLPDRSIPTEPADQGDVAFLSDWWALMQDIVGPYSRSEQDGHPPTIEDDTGTFERSRFHSSPRAAQPPEPTFFTPRRVPQDSLDSHQASIDHLLALSHVRAHLDHHQQQEQQQQQVQQIQCKDISPQQLFRKLPVATQSTDLQRQLTASALTAGQSCTSTLQTMSEETPTRSQAGHSTDRFPLAIPPTPPSPTLRAAAFAGISTTKKRGPVKKKVAGGTATTKAKSATATAPPGAAKRKRSQTVASKSAVCREAASKASEGMRAMDGGEELMSPLRDPGERTGQLIKEESADMLSASSRKQGEEVGPYDENDANAALIAELARYAATCDVNISLPVHQQIQLGSPSAPTITEPPLCGVNATSWASIAALPGPDFRAMLAPTSIAQPSLMLLPDVTTLALRQQTPRKHDYASINIPSTPRQSEGLVRHGQISEHPGAFSEPAQRLWAEESYSRTSNEHSSHHEGNSICTNSIFSYLNPSGDDSAFKSADAPNFEGFVRPLTMSAFETYTERLRGFARDGRQEQTQTKSLTQDDLNILSTTAFIEAAGKDFDNPLTHDHQFKAGQTCTPGHTRVVIPTSALVHATSMRESAPARGRSHVSHKSFSHYTNVQQVGSTVHSEQQQQHHGRDVFSNENGSNEQQRHSPRHTRNLSDSSACRLLPRVDESGEGSPYRLHIDTDTDTVNINMSIGGSAGEAATTSRRDSYCPNVNNVVQENFLDSSCSSPSSRVLVPSGVSAASSNISCGIPPHPPLFTPTATTMGNTIATTTGIPPHCLNLERSKVPTEADRYMAAKLQRGMIAQEKAREKMAEIFGNRKGGE